MRKSLSIKINFKLSGKAQNTPYKDFTYLKEYSINTSHVWFSMKKYKILNDFIEKQRSIEILRDENC